MHSALMVLWKERKETKEDYADRRSQEKLTVNMSFPLASANVKGQGGGGVMVPVPMLTLNISSAAWLVLFVCVRIGL